MTPMPQARFKPSHQRCLGVGNAPQTPQNADDPHGQLKLKRALRAQPGDDLLTEAAELFGILTRKKSAPCRQPVDEGILAAPRLAFLGPS